ncbi:MAG TPA: hypothetical protein VEI82_08745, partial [Myxococcota bacterium]|nr:hypothetical protein [Myxococcota bacterium]
MADRDLVIADEHLAHEQPHDLLALLDRELFGVGAEARVEALERLGELEVARGVVQLGIERVELGLQGRFALAQHGRAGAQLVERDQLFLVGLDQALEGAACAHQVALQSLAAVAGGVLGAEALEPPLDLGLDQRWVVEQTQHVAPDELVELLQARWPVAAHLPVQAARAVGARAAVVVVDAALAGRRLAAVVGIAAARAHDDPLQQRRPTGVPRRQAPASLKPLGDKREGLLVDQRRYRNVDPLLGSHPLARLAAVPLAALTCGARQTRALLGHARLAVPGLPGVRRVAQHPPDRRLAPSGSAGPGRHAALAQRARDRADRLTVVRVAIEDLAHDPRLGLVDLQERVGMLGLLDIPVAVGGAGQHRHRARPRAVQRPAPGALGDLRALILADHPLELAQQLVLRRAGTLRLLREDHLHPDASKLLEQQHLIGIATREAIGCMAQQHLERPLRRPIAQPLQSRPDQRRARESLVLEYKVIRHQQPTSVGQLT